MIATAPGRAAARPGVEPVLEVSGLVKRFGGVTAVDGIDLCVAAHDPLAVIGPNGAGKSTLLKLILGELRADEGEILIAGRPHGRRPRPDRIARQGVALAHQVPMPFNRLSVRENVRVGALHHRGGGGHEFVSEVLDTCGLLDKADRSAGQLNLLDLKRLELARALSLDPRLLLLDEVAAGLVGSELRSIVELIARIRDTGVALVVVEHVEGVIRELVDRVLVLDWGRPIASGTPEAIAADQRVRAVYLGAPEATPSAPAQTPADMPEPRALVLVDAHHRTAPRRHAAALRIRGLSAGYGSILALRDIDLDVEPGQVVAVLGANGAGKTTLTRTVSGLTPVRTGTIHWGGQDITTLPVHDRAKLGIAHCQEGRRLFAGMTVAENLLVAARSRAARDGFQQRLEWVRKLFPILHERSAQPAETLSGGQQQMLAIGRALISQPRLIMFDEISLGLAPTVIDDIYRAIAEIRQAGISIVLVEQSVRRSLAISDRAYVLERGRVSFVGDPRELLDEGRLDQAYFGTGAAASSEEAAAPAMGTTGGE